jgi:hypothetical protein
MAAVEIQSSCFKMTTKGDGVKLALADEGTENDQGRFDSG